MCALVSILSPATANSNSSRAPDEKCCGRMICRRTNSTRHCVNDLFQGFIPVQSSAAGIVSLYLLPPDWQSDFLQPPMTALATMRWKVSLSVCVLYDVLSRALQKSTRSLSPSNRPRDKQHLTSSVCSVPVSANICLPESLCAFVHPSVCVDVIASSTHLCLPPWNGLRPRRGVLPRSRPSL